MSDILLGLVYIFAELGVVLLLVSIGLVIRFFVNSKKEAKIGQELIEYIKTMITSHRSLLDEHFKNSEDKKKTAYNIETLNKNEKALYERLIKVSITKNVNLLKPAVEDIDVLINNYLRILPTGGSEDDASASGDTHEHRLKKENSSLRDRVNTLEISLKVSNDTLENMLTEMSAMYEGGKDGDNEKLKDKVYELKQSLDGVEEIKDINVDDVEEIKDINVDDEVEELSLDVPDLDAEDK